jgi:membrane protease YdiL (CAAX protease family)
LPVILTLDRDIVFAIPMANSTEQDSTGQSVRPNSAIVRFAQTRPLTLFFLLTYAFTWTLWLGVGSLIPDNKAEQFGELLVLTGAFGPTLAALITRWLTDRDLNICRVWTGWRSLGTGLAFGLTAFFVSTLVVPSASLVKAPIYALHWSSLLHWSTYGINYSTFLGGPVNEEPGWRGFALPRLQKRYGPVWATLILAPLWAGWHLPLFQIQGWNSANPWQFLLILVGIGFLLTAAANISKFNVVVAIVLHAFFNTSSGVGNALTQGLPRRAHEMMIYTFVVLGGGAIVGLATLRVQGEKIPLRTVASGATFE